MRVYSFFNKFPSDLISSLLRQWFLVESPMVLLIDGEATDKQKRMLISGSGPSLTYGDKGEPFYVDAKGNRLDNLFDPEHPKKVPALGYGSVADIKAYHLIAEYSDELGKIVYRIGFCTRLADGSFAYQTKMLDEKSPLLRYVSEDLRHPEYSKLFPCDRKTQTQKRDSQDFLLLKYMVLEIKAAGGLTRDPLENRARFSEFSPKALAWMNGENSRKIFINTLNQARLEKLLHHVAFGEQVEVIKMLREDITLLESGKKAPVQLCAPEMFCPEISFFDLVATFKDWFLGRAIVEAINQSDLTKEEQEAYKANFLTRLNAVEKNEIEAFLDNLLNKGIQILDEDMLEANPSERERYKRDVLERNSYHLIIQTLKENEKRSVIRCVLGYRGQNPETQEYEYRGIEIPENHELFKVRALELYEELKAADNGHGVRHMHYFTRTNQDLALVREKLKEFGVETQIKMLLRPSNFENLLKYFEKGIHGWQKENWSDDRLREQWYGEICAELRLFTPLLWQLWLSDKNPWSLNDDEIKTFVNSATRPVGNKNYYNDPIFPCSSSLGDRFIAVDLSAPVAWRVY